MKQNKLAILTLLTLLGSLILLACQPKAVNSEEAVSALAIKTEPTPAPVNSEPVTIAAVGDIMLGSTFPNETRMPPNDGADLLGPVTPILSAADIAFGNLEGPILEGGVSAK